jgi:large subunit ribosomal protein L16
MLLPKRTKFRKHHRGRLKGKSTANTVIFGDFGLQATQPGWLTSRQIEAVRRSIIRHVRASGKIWTRVFPDKPISQRSAESRMGSGKGSTAFWVAVIKPGAVLFEITGLNEEQAFSVLKLAANKLPIKTKILKKENNDTTANYSKRGR